MFLHMMLSHLRRLHVFVFCFMFKKGEHFLWNEVVSLTFTVCWDLISSNILTCPYIWSDFFANMNYEIFL